MAIEKGIPSNFLGMTQKALGTEIGLDIPELGINKGDSVDYAVQQIWGYLSNLSSEEQGDDTIDADLSCLGGSGNSLCASKITNRIFKYTLTPKSSGDVDFSWDMSAIRDALPKGYSTLSVSIIANSSQSILPLMNSNSIKASGSFNLKYYPVAVDVKFRISTTCGQIELQLSLNLNNPALTGDYATTMDLRDFTSGSLQSLTRKQYDEMISQEICLLKNQIALLQEQISNGN